MANKGQNSLTNIWIWILIIFMFGLFMYGLTAFAEELTTHSNANLDNASITYASQITGVNLSVYEVSAEEINGSYIEESGGDTLVDYALDFLFGKSKAKQIENTVKSIFTIPETVLVTLLRLDKDDWNWLLDIFNFLFWIGTLIAIVYFVRGRG